MSADRTGRAWIRAALSTACGVLFCASAVGAGSPAAAPTGPESPPSPKRTVAPGATALSIIESPTVLCDMDEPAANLCEMSWSYLLVSTGSSDYLTYMTVKIDGKQRAIYHGFFQSYMYVPFDMHPDAFKVDCGRIGSGGDPDLGMAHTYYISAVDTTGAFASNFGAVLCPSTLLFGDGFEQGTLTPWSRHTP